MSPLYTAEEQRSIREARYVLRRSREQQVLVPWEVVCDAYATLRNLGHRAALRGWRARAERIAAERDAVNERAVWLLARLDELYDVLGLEGHARHPVDATEQVRIRLADAEEERDAARAALAASQREADRLRHGEPIESDYICPDSLALTECRASLARCMEAVRGAIQYLYVAMAHVDMGEVEDARESLRAALVPAAAPMLCDVKAQSYDTIVDGMGQSRQAVVLRGAANAIRSRGYADAALRSRKDGGE